MAKERENTALFSVYEELPPWDPSSPEKNLLRALIVTAAADVNKAGPVKKRALEYFLNGDDDYIFSFRSACDYLNVDPELILEAIGVEERARFCLEQK